MPGTNNGDLDISPLFAETPIGQLENGTGQNSNLHLTRGNSYRFTFQGKGFDFVAKVYELPETSSPLRTLTVNDPNSSYASGKVGIIAASEGSFTIPGDATFDNFLVTTAEPRLEATVTGGNIRLTWPIIPFRLQVCTSFTAPVWTTITSGIVESGGMNVYTAPTAGVKFYRLVYP